MQVFSQEFFYFVANFLGLTIKVKQKISQSFRTMRGAKIFYTISGFISTNQKQKINVLQAIQDASRLAANLITQLG